MSKNGMIGTGKVRWAAAILAAAVWSVTGNAAWAAYDPLKDPDPVKIKGESVEYFFDQGKAVGKGHVEIHYHESVLTADEVEVNLESKEARAKGNIVLLQEGALYRGQSVFVDLDSGSAEIDRPEATIAPFYRGRSQKVERSPEGEFYTLSDGYLTTCPEGTDCADGTPFYRIDAKEVVYYPNDKLVLKQVIIRLRNLPLFYLPVMVLPIKQIDKFPIQMEFGTNSEWGAFALTKLRYYLNEDHDGNLLMDVRENQGFAYGFEHFYRTPQLGKGVVRTYLADDDCAEENTDCSRAKDHIAPTSSRYRVQMRHVGEIAPDTGLNFELNKLSDEYLIQDFFFREEFERTPTPDNYLSLIHAKEEYTVSALARYRLDDFVSTVERLPEARFDTHTQRLGKTNFYLRHETQGAWLNKTFKDLERSDHNEDSGRVSSRQILSYALKAGIWSVKPFVGSRHTFYTRNRTGEEREFLRNNVESGVDVSTKFFKVYDRTFHHLGIDIERFRHIFTPNVSYFYQSRPTYDRLLLFEFDRVDALDHESFFEFDLENKIQIEQKSVGADGREGRIKRDLIRLIVAADLEAPHSNATRLEEIRILSDFYPYTWLSVAADTRYEYEPDAFTSANFDSHYEFGNWKVGFGQRYENDFSNQSTVHADWQATPEWKFGIYERFDFAKRSEAEGGRNNEFGLAVEKRQVFCWTIRLYYSRTHQENGFYVTLTPTVFDNTSFRNEPSYWGLNPIWEQKGEDLK